MKILLTGAKGNLGQALQSRGRAHVWSTLNRGEWDQLEQKLKDVDVVIHAASDLKTSAWSNPVALMDSNVAATANLLEALRPMTKKPRLLYISSCAVYGQSQITAEDSSLAPITTNGIAKLLNEKMIEEFSSQNSVDYTIVRAFNTFGGDDKFSIISHLQNSIRSAKPFVMFNEGRSQRDFVHVEDAAEIVLKMLERKLPHRILNLGSGETTKIRDIVDKFTLKNPKLEIVRKEREETEYSRADVARLRSLFPDFQFQKVLDSI